MHALITGASSGLGDGFARHFAEQGWSLSLAARRLERLEALAGELDAPTFVRVTDLADMQHCRALVDDVVAALGPVDVLINNAGIQYVEPTVGVSPERIQHMMTLNVTSPMALIHHVLPAMLERGAGTIVNIASMAALTNTPGMCHYNGSKSALAACSETLRVELEGTGVHVLTVYPGPVTSDMEAAARANYAPSKAADILPTGSPEGLARLVARAIERKRPRVIYPRVYGLVRHARLLSQWATDRATPGLVGATDEPGH